MENWKIFLLWSAVINTVFLLLWVGLLAARRDFIYEMHSRWFKLTPEQFDAIHYGGIALYKLLTLFFNIVPLLVLWLTSGRCIN
ncbi:MAG TPA: hypothetical protein PLL10_02200 [Elusimicrobiales bacterium]|nr:hypothetical protein [Elusimicrobiales bacterium]